MQLIDLFQICLVTIYILCVHLKVVWEIQTSWYLVNELNEYDFLWKKETLNETESVKCPEIDRIDITEITKKVRPVTSKKNKKELYHSFTVKKKKKNSNSVKKRKKKRLKGPVSVCI